MYQPVDDATDATWRPRDVGKIATDVVTITPDIAKAMLADQQNTARTGKKLQARRVALYAQQMSAGQWELTGETIQVSKTGKLLNGFHRLNACIAADVPFDTVIVRGVDDRSMKVMDTGMNRRPADAFADLNVKCANSVAAAAKLLILWRMGKLQQTHEMTRIVTRHRLYDFVEEHQPGLERAAVEAQRVYRAIRANAAGMTAALFELQAIDEDLALDFVEAVITGVDLESGDPRLALRNWCVNQRQAVSSRDPHCVIAMTTKAWNAWLDGNKLTHLKGYKRGMDVPRPNGA